MKGVSLFVENAVKLLGAAENALESGHVPTDMTILISPHGGIHMVANSDWPLDSLQSYHGASTAYRVSRNNEKVRIDGREGNRTCRFESENTQLAARLILGSRVANRSVLALIA